MPKTAPKPQLTAVTALNPWCWGIAGGAVVLAAGGGSDPWVDLYHGCHAHRRAQHPGMLRPPVADTNDTDPDFLVQRAHQVILHCCP